jgi:UDP-2,4-diacetamido-2,4,6-trideoxy-beta-L-altropyranose hydrolase
MVNQILPDDVGIYLRNAEPGDCRQLWILANDPVTRAASFTDGPIDWSTHVEWFDRVLKSNHRHLFVAENAEGDFAGQIRFDIEQVEAVVSVAIDPSKRGHGLGAALIHAGTQRCLDEVPSVTVVHAFIRKSNEVSVAVFTKGGYRLAGLTEIRGYESYDMIFQRGVEE